MVDKFFGGQLKTKNLNQWREKLCLSFAKKCIKLNNMKLLFPILKKKHDMDMDTRLIMKYDVNEARSQKYKFSAIPQMQRMLNKDYIVKVRNFNECIKRSKTI